MSEQQGERDKAIWWAVVQACEGRNDGGVPHATTWARGGHRNDVPTLCDRCARLIGTLQALRSEWEAEVRASVEAEEPEWGFGWHYVDGSVVGVRMSCRKDAEDHIQQYPDDLDFGRNFLVQRTPERPAGPWLPVSTAEQTTVHEIERQS